MQYFITATDTHAGKTTVTCALLDHFNQQKKTTLALKPVATGCNIEQLRPDDDITLLHQHMSYDLPPKNIAHFTHTTPAAPSIANPDKPPRAKNLAEFCQENIHNHPTDITLIEGAGGWLCPLNHQETLADLVKITQTPVILVVGLTLGCINHALLSEFHVKQNGLLKGWIANYCHEDTKHSDAMLHLLQQQMQSPILGTLSYGTSSSSRKLTLKENLLT